METARPPSRSEYVRLLNVGVNPRAAAVLAAGHRPDDNDERAYWRQQKAGPARTYKACAAHARAQAERRAARRAAA